MLHCNGIDPFVTLMGNFNWGPISCNDIVSKRFLGSIPGLATYFRFSLADSIGAVVRYWQKESGSFRSYSCWVRSFRPGSFRPDFRGKSFRPNLDWSFRPNF